MENKKIKTGNVDLGPEYEDEKNQKLRITMWLDGDIYDELNKRAESGEGKGRYQTLMNELLRQVLFKDRRSVSRKSVKDLHKNVIEELLEERGWEAIDNSIDQKMRKGMAEIMKEVRDLVAPMNQSTRKRATLKAK